MNFFKNPEWILRIGIAGEFLGHGAFALMIKESWLPYFTSIGISQSIAVSLLPIIGITDMLVAIIVLIKPIKIILLWASLWGFITALIRPISGEFFSADFFDFIERFANWAAPLALLAIKGLPKTLREWFSS